MLEPLPEPIATAVKAVFEQVELLRRTFPGRRFTPGDKLVGDIGEALGELFFELTPLGSNERKHDGKCAATDRLIQVKATGGNRVGLGLKKETFDRLLVFKLYPDGTFEVLYNGDGQRVAEHIKDNSSPSIQATALRTLNIDVPDSERVRRRTTLGKP
jgi:hypothetical protein